MKKTVFVTLLLITTLIHAAEGYPYQIKQLTMRDNLAHYSVLSLYQDPRGMVWMGTRNGVSIYDGNQLHLYRHEQGNPSSLPSNYVRQITGDGKQTIYLLTLREVCQFDLRTEQFSTLSTERFEAICYHKQLYLGVGNKVYTYRNGQMERLLVLPEADSKVFSLTAADGTLWIGTEEHGLYLWKEREESLSHPIAAGKVSTIYQQRNGSWWFGTWDEGLYRLKEGQLTNYRHRPGDETSLCSNLIRCLCEDKEGTLWIGSFGGLSCFDETTGQFLNHMTYDETEGSVGSLLCDRQGTLWVGSYFGGVQYFHPQLNIYHTVPIARQGSKGINYPVVGSMTEDDEGNLWICTDGSGLNCLNRRTGEITRYLASDKPGTLSHNNVKCLYYDRQRQALWIGTHLGGLNRLDLRSRRFQRYTIQTDGKPKDLANIICDILPQGDDLLLATHDGVYRFQIEKAHFVPLFKERETWQQINLALDLEWDNKGQLWIAGAERGAYCYNFAKEKMTLYEHRPDDPNSLSSNGINLICCDRQGQLWFCTAETGIDRYLPESDRFINYNEEKNGLLSDCVYGACTLSDSTMLVITDRGYAWLDRTNNHFNNVDVRGGFPLSAINLKALYQAADEEIYIGGIDGMISFHPNELNHERSSGQLFPYKLLVNDQEVKVGDPSGILHDALNHTQKIRLKAGQNRLSISYALTDYLPIYQPHILYKLHKFQEKWTPMGRDRMVTFTNLNPGTYLLEAQIEGNESLHSHLLIEVMPPLYKTWWAWTLYLLLGCSAAFYLFRSWQNRIRLKAELKYERKHLQDVEALNQHKLRFFTNISHEFRTPLTLIIGQMEMLLQLRNFEPSIYNRILAIYKSGLQLQELIGELLDFRKQEQGYMHLHVKEQNLVDFLYENYLLFKEYAASHKINFKFNKSSDTLIVWYDEKQLQKVVNNLLSNAFKYTPEGSGEISLSVRRGDGEVVVEVADNGMGIDARDLEHIFDRFYQAEYLPAKKGTGIGVGLALTKGIVEQHHGKISVFSKPGEGSTFSFTLPLDGRVYSEAEKRVQDTTPLSTTSEATHFEPMSGVEPLTVEEQPDEMNHSVLIVEDDTQMRLMLKDIFTPYYKVTIAATGEEALTEIENQQPDLIVTDVLMPGISGIELCKRLKKSPRTCHIPVMLLTARTSLEHRLEGLKTGADDFITKPFDINILLARCKNLINNRILLQEKYTRQRQEDKRIIATSPADKEFMDKAVQIIKNHIDKPEFSVDQFAREMGVARTKLYAKIKEISGQTPNELIMQHRLQRAAQMLINNPELNITEIAERVGFCSSRYFSRCFKESYHVTPQAYRRGDEE